MVKRSYGIPNNLDQYSSSPDDDNQLFTMNTVATFSFRHWMDRIWITYRRQDAPTESGNRWFFHGSKEGNASDAGTNLRWWEQAVSSDYPSVMRWQHVWRLDG